MNPNFNRLDNLKNELVELFLKYGVVPQGYDMELWTEAENETLNSNFPKYAQSFETVVIDSVNDMLQIKEEYSNES